MRPRSSSCAIRIGVRVLEEFPRPTGSTSGTKQPSSPTPCTTGRPFARQSRMSSSPYAGAQCTMPVPSSMVTKVGRPHTADRPVRRQVVEQAGVAHTLEIGALYALLDGVCGVPQNRTEESFGHDQGLTAKRARSASGTSELATRAESRRAPQRERNRYARRHSRPRMTPRERGSTAGSTASSSIPGTTCIPRPRPGSGRRPTGPRPPCSRAQPRARTGLRRCAGRRARPCSPGR